MTTPDLLVALACLIYLAIFAVVVSYVLDDLALTRQTRRDEPRYDDAWFATKSEAEKRAGAGRLLVELEFVDNFTPKMVARLVNACACGDCYHPAFGPDTDGKPCDWCHDCACASADHTWIGGAR